MDGTFNLITLMECWSNGKNGYRCRLIGGLLIPKVVQIWLRELVFSKDKITITQNTICTESLIRAKSKISAKKSNLLKSELGIESDNVALFCGGMYEYKKMCFLIEACKKIKEQITDFHMIFIGDGPKAELVDSFSAECNWVHFVGEKQSLETVPYFAISKLLLMPGLVGLSVIDSFALGIPIVSTNIPIHSPEFSYLENGINAKIANYDINDYSKQVSNLLISKKDRDVLIHGARNSRIKYQLNNMTYFFSQPIVNLLSSIDSLPNKRDGKQF